MTLIGGIIYAIMAAVIAGLAVGYRDERKLRQNTDIANDHLSDHLEAMTAECSELRSELARMEGVAQGRECDAMQRRFLESLQENGQSTVRIGRRQDS